MAAHMAGEPLGLNVSIWPILAIANAMLLIVCADVRTLRMRTGNSHNYFVAETCNAPSADNDFIVTDS
eukprot:45734-Lingulodinium_polyedra.AAC.1